MFAWFQSLKLYASDSDWYYSLKSAAEAAIRQTPNTNTHAHNRTHAGGVRNAQTHLLHLSNTDAHVRINTIFAGLIAASFLTEERHATLHTIIMSRRQRRVLVQGVITGKRNSRWQLYHIVKQPSAGHLNTPQGHKQRCKDFRGSTICLTQTWVTSVCPCPPLY